MKSVIIEECIQSYRVLLIILGSFFLRRNSPLSPPPHRNLCGWLTEGDWPICFVSLGKQRASELGMAAGSTGYYYFQCAPEALKAVM